MAEKKEEKKVPRKSDLYRGDVSLLKRDIGNLVTLASQIAREGSVTVKLNKEKDPVTFGAQSIKSFRSQINKKLTSLASEYSLAMRGRRVKRAAGRAGGLPNLSLISPSYQTFWANANLGPLNPLNYDYDQIENRTFPKVEDVINKLPLLVQEGITSSSLLQSVWATYIDVNGLRNAPPTQKDLDQYLGQQPYSGMNRADAVAAINKLPQFSALYLHVDDHMLESLGSALDWLEDNTPTAEQESRYQAKLQAQAEAGEKKKLNAPEKFDRYAFKRYWLATIGPFYTVPRPSSEGPNPQQIEVGNDVIMTVDQEAVLRTEGNRQRVQDEITVLKGVRDLWNKKLGTGDYAPKKTTRKTKA